MPAKSTHYSLDVLPDPVLLTASTVKFFEDSANGAQSIGLKAAASLAADVTFTLPSADGTANTPLVTSGAGVLSFGTTLASMVSITSTAFTSSGQAALSMGPFGVAAGNTGETRYLELAANGSNYVAFKAPDSITSNVVWTLPSADGTNGQMLSTNGSGTLSWATGGGGGGTGTLSIVEFTATTTSASSSTTIATSAVPVSVSLQITTAYTAGTTISIGYTGSTSFLMATTDNLPGTVGIYTVNLMGLSWTSNPVLVTISGTPAAGACRVRVLYATTVNT